MTFGERILKFRKELNLTQNEVAEKLFVTYQAISQWENGITKPDIDMLPKLAEVFNKTIDEFFYDEVASVFKVKNYMENKLYIVVAKGKDLIKVVDYDKSEDFRDNIEIKIEGDAVDIQSNFSIHIEGGVEGDVCAGNSVTCGGVNGDISAGNNVTCGGVNGGVSAGNNITCGGVNGGVSAGNNIDCDDICGGVAVGHDLYCEYIKGNVQVTGNIDCKTIEADVIDIQGNIVYKDDAKYNDSSKENTKIIIKK